LSARNSVHSNTDMQPQRKPDGTFKPKVEGSLSEKLWAFVNKLDDGSCWNWTGGQDGKGYGVLRVSSNLVKRTHIVAYELKNGKVPKGKILRHTCDNRRCCNPSHLIPGTLEDNVADRQARGRQANGDKIHTTRLNIGDVVEIRRMATEGVRHTIIAAKFKLQSQYAKAIIERKYWKHI
jgi:hypothetical protein